MTPERLAEIEQQARANSEMGCVCLTCDCATLLDLIAHIRDLEAQLRGAREYVKRAGHTNDAGGDPCNYFMRFHEKSRYICTCGYEEALATATPPSPEVGECPRCEGRGFVRTWVDGQRDSEPCSWCRMSGHVPPSPEVGG